VRLALPFLSEAAGVGADRRLRMHRTTVELTPELVPLGKPRRLPR
jgi:hypothetical protein